MRAKDSIAIIWFIIGMAGIIMWRKRKASCAYRNENISGNAHILKYGACGVA